MERAATRQHGIGQHANHGTIREQRLDRRDAVLVMAGTIGRDDHDIAGHGKVHVARRFDPPALALHAAGRRHFGHLEAKGFGPHLCVGIDRRVRVIRPGSAWRLSASGRQDWNSDFEDSRSLRLAAHYAWRPDTEFWLAAGTGIKQPSFVERYGYTPDSFIGNPNLEAEENRHLSLGVQHARGRSIHTLVLFRDQLENEINGFAFVPAVGGFTSVNEDGDSDRAGVEWASTWQWSSGQLRVGASALNAQDSDGTREIRRPGWQAFSMLQQSWQRVRLDAGLFRQDEQVDFDFAAWPARRADLAGYTLAHAELSVGLSDGVRIGVRGNNLLDETYEDILGYRAPGRGWALRLQVDL